MHAIARRALRSVSAFAGVVAVLVTAACSGDDDSGAAADPVAALEQAGQRLAEASSVRFTVEGDGLPDSGTVVVGAEGVAVPPASFEGDVRIRSGALPASVAVVSVDGRLWAELPLTSGYEEINADDLGFGDPGMLIDPDHGVARLLSSGEDVTAGERVRVDGEVYEQVESVLPGDVVGSVLAIADPDAQVRASWALDPDTGRLRQATLTGPFYDDGEQTYTVRLDDYDAPAEISAPTS